VIAVPPAVWLLGAFGLSLAGNAFLGWQWAQASAECDSRVERAAREAAEAELIKAAKDDEQAVGISTIVGAATNEAVKAAIGGTHVREHEIRTVVVTGECRMPGGLPSLAPAIDEANAAAR
jgi:hypothetical protein